MPGYEVMGQEELAALTDIFKRSGGVLFAHGYHDRRQGIYRVRDFEKAVAAKFGAGYCQAVSSGTAALYIALKALGVKAGDEVITSSYTFVATVEAIIETGATPILTEIDESLNMDPLDLERRLTSKTKAIVPVHMAGVTADMDAILAIARRRGIRVLEDSAQNIGVSHGGKPVGTLGDVGCYSLDFNKTITTGEGGLIITNDRAIFEYAREFHDHGHEYNPKVGRADDTRKMGGFNYRMSELQGAVGLAQLAKLDDIVAKQRRNKQALKSALQADANFKVRWRKIADPAADGGDCLVFFLDSRERALSFAAQLAKQGLGTKNLPDAIKWHFAGTWDHMLDGYAHLAPCAKRWPRSEELVRTAIALPVRAIMTDAEIDKTVSIVRSVYREVCA